jgi:hypothetical protein
VFSLTELSAREVAASIPFEMIEVFSTPVPEQLQLRVAYWSFPEEEEDIRLYSCLANGSSDEFNKGEYLYKAKTVKEPLQIGFHLSAVIAPSAANNSNSNNAATSTGGKQSSQSTSVTFDRRKIVSCQCSCNSNAEWCSHVVALCLHRIHMVQLGIYGSEHAVGTDKMFFFLPLLSAWQCGTSGARVRVSLAAGT